VCLVIWFSCNQKNVLYACFTGDFGGYFGLFLGGSAMSLIEIFDLLIYNALVKLTSRKAKPRMTQAMHITDIRNLAEEQIWPVSVVSAMFLRLTSSYFLFFSYHIIFAACALCEQFLVNILLCYRGFPKEYLEVYSTRTEALCAENRGRRQRQWRVFVEGHRALGRGHPGSENPSPTASVLRECCKFLSGPTHFWTWKNSKNARIAGVA